MESLVDLVTTSFQAVLAVAVVTVIGYAFNSTSDPKIAGGILSAARKALLPCLIFSVFATTSMTAQRVLQQWPSLVIALITHIASIAFGLLCQRFVQNPRWLVESLSFNSVASYPLLLVQALYHLSTNDTRGLYHLKWRTRDSAEGVLMRATEYILINLIITQLARNVLTNLLPGLLRVYGDQIPQAEQDIDYEDDDESTPPAEPVTVRPNGDEEADERTPLVSSSSLKPPPVAIKTWNTITSSPNIAAALLGLFIGLVKPVQRALIGDPKGDLTGSWQSLGTGLILLGGAYAVVEILAIGASLRAAERKVSPDEEVPPALGTVLVITFWRYVIIPVIVLHMVYGFRKIPSTKAYLQDPAYSFVLAIVTVSPPALPYYLPAFRSYVHFHLHYVALITAVPLAIAVAISGRGVSYETDFDVVEALKKAVGGGVAGAAAMVVQVLTLMPLRTVMNYQYRYGGGFKGSVKNLWNDGGFRRYYAGLGAALFQAPLSRFGDTAANAGILALLASLTWPVLIKTVAASLASATFRMTLTPIDTLKTTQQTRGGKAGLKLLRERVKENGIGCLWWGALATAAATFVGHYPWFGTYNYLGDVLPQPHNLIQKLLRQAFIGFAASVVSDTISNSLRVVKTYRQVHERNVGYWTAAKEIVAAEGVLALFGRGLPTRLLTNGLQGLLFSILWKLFADLIASRTGK